MESDPKGLTAEELEAQEATELPDREALTTIDAVGASTTYWGQIGIVPAPEPVEPVQ